MHEYKVYFDFETEVLTLKSDKQGNINPGKIVKMLYNNTVSVMAPDEDQAKREAEGRIIQTHQPNYFIVTKVELVK